MTEQLRNRPEGARLRAPRALRIVAPGRLHIGFLDLNGGLGRRFGSLGVSLERPATRLLMETAERASASGPDSDRALVALSRVAEAFGVDDRVRIVVEEALPAHSGLGSGTQMALAVGVGASRLAGRDLPAAEIAAALSRGARSSIGLAAFEGGGVLLDGGKPVGVADAPPPPLLSRIPVPEAWRILLIFDRGRAGLSGARETEAMDALPEFPEALADRLCRLVVMAALPAAATGDANAFGIAVGEIQRRVGDHFAAFQGGRFTSADVAEALFVIQAAGVPGVGQSSWGPTGFAVFGSATQAEAVAQDLRSRFADRPNLLFDVVRGANDGAVIEEASHSGASGL
jgi:beta-RFAP synthase